MKPPTPEGARLREAREKAGLSQGDLARRCKVTQSTVSLWELGGRMHEGAWKALQIPAKAWEAVKAPASDKRPRIGRPTAVEPLVGMGAREVATAIYGTPTQEQINAVAGALRGKTDFTVRRLAALLAAQPGIDARTIVAELDRRFRAEHD